jgi:hypothetical protein
MIGLSVQSLRCLGLRTSGTSAQEIPRAFSVGVATNAERQTDVANIGVDFTRKDITG